MRRFIRGTKAFWKYDAMESVTMVKKRERLDVTFRNGSVLIIKGRRGSTVNGVVYARIYLAINQRTEDP